MLYYLFHWLHESLHVPGAGVFEYITFRSGESIVTALFIMLFLGKPFIRWMKNLYSLTQKQLERITPVKG